MKDQLMVLVLNGKNGGMGICRQLCCKILGERKLAFDGQFGQNFLFNSILPAPRTVSGDS
jgi:hypothetical protein